MESLYKLFGAHSPRPDTIQMRFEHSFTGNISIATLIKAPDNVMPAFEHTHDEYEFILPLTSIPFLTREEAVYFGEVGWVYPVPANKRHGVKYDLADVTHHDIAIRKEYLESIIEDKGMTGIEFNKLFRVTRHLSLYIDAFREECGKGEHKDAHKLKHLAALICVELIDEGLSPNVDERKEKSGYQRGLRSTAEFLNANYQSDISMAELAEMCGFSPNYFAVSFKKLFGDTPQAYLTKLRISKAKLLLETSRDTMETIAAECGFKRPNTFTTAFKAATGMTPSKYRDSR